MEGEGSEWYGHLMQMEEIHCQKKLIIWSKQEIFREDNQGNCGKSPGDGWSNMMFSTITVLVVFPDTPLSSLLFHV